MDPQSLDGAIQHALAGLYPPFEATAPTVLGQVFRLLDSDFQGDGLSFLLDFLIPAKRLCEQVREAACAPYSHCLFLHSGWPLCLRDEVVLHLAPLSPLALRQGDFYLQVEPRQEQSVCIMLKCLSSDLCTVATKPVPVSSYPTLFTAAWLESINGASEGSPLRHCLVASEDGIVPVPWTKITSPEFVDDRPRALNVLSPVWGSLRLEALDLSSPQELHQARSPGGLVLPTQSLVKRKDHTHRDKYPGLIKVEQTRPGEVAFQVDNVTTQDMEGDYVALLDFSLESGRGSPNKGVKAFSGCPLGMLEELSRTKETPFSHSTLPLSGIGREPPSETQDCAKPADGLEEEPCTLSLRRKIDHEAPTYISECLPQEPYQDTVVNPLSDATDHGTGVSELAASRTQGPLGSPENVTQHRPEPKKASSPHLCPASLLATLTPEAKMEKKTSEGSGRLTKPVTGPSQSSSSSRPSTPGLNFPFLKGQRQDFLGPEKASLQPDRPWKVLCSFYSPKLNRAKRLGKAGTTQSRTSGLAADSGPLNGEKADFPEASAGPPESNLTLDEESRGPELTIGALSMELLHSRIACLPGGQDRAGQPLLLVSTTEGTWGTPWCTASEVTKLLCYLCTIPRSEDKTRGLTVVMDARKLLPQPALISALQAAQALVPASIRTVLFLGEKEAALQLETIPDIQVEVLASLKALNHYVDPSQLPPALEGPFPYCHSEWKLDPFLAELRQACSLLQVFIKEFEEFEKGDPAGGVKEAERYLSKSKERMEAVLRDPGLLSLQHDGGTTLARLQQEAARLDCNPHVRSHLAEATTLYALMDERLHVLVKASNHVLGKMELRVRLCHLETAVRQVSEWMEQEERHRLPVLTLKDGSLESVEKAQLEFEDFFLQAAAQYRRGLELSKQAAQLGATDGGVSEAGGSEELAAFTASQQAFQARLTHFYMAAERQRTDLETLLHLHRFCKKITWFHMDCQDLMSQLRLSKAQKASPGAQRRLHRYLRRLASEFPAEKLVAIGLQAASLSRTDLGQDLWAEARLRHQEIQTLLEKASAHCPCPAGPAAHPAPRDSQRAAARGQGGAGGAASGGRRKQHLQASPGLDPSLPQPCWSSQSPRDGQRRPFQRGPVPREAGLTDDTKVPQEVLDPAPERPLASFFSWQRLLLRQGRGLHLTGGSFSSEGTDSQTSLEDSPQTSPPASL
ncbi:uncharacterized protein KIAA1755 homolog isoform X2 [Erinaceus europaeus]|uniref:Uncharacterized protein KIAA1755 homolog isoform X2 n=1 Tax=Erinaceus europaeus TaxID=9365 RepID=A0ABM3XAC1_ERIEU|nr:uncharacterized protein KIAA1755 homolog isoform X2 [Erinaceus europaeus]